MSTETNLSRSGYQQSELGLIPDDWQVCTIKDVGHPVRGSSPRPAGDPRFFNGAFIPWLTVASLTNIPQSRLSVTEIQSCLTEEGSHLSRTLYPETLILANSGATLGVAKILGVKCCANDGIAAVLNLSAKASPKFLAYYINSQTEYLRDVVATGNGQPNLNTELISDLKIPLPPTLAEQEAIAEALGDADAWIESLEALIVKKRDLKQAAMQQLLTGERRLPGVEGEWKIYTLGDLFRFGGGLSASREQLSENGYCYLHYGDIHGMSKTFVDVERECHAIPKLDVELNKVSPASRLRNGDVVFVDASEDVDGTNKHVVIDNPKDMPFISGLHTIVAKPKTNELEPIYCRFCFQAESVKRQFRFYAVGTKVSGVSKTNIAKIEIELPQPEEQLAIADILADMDSEIDVLETKLVKARQIKQGMMQELLTGRKRLVEKKAAV